MPADTIQVVSFSGLVGDGAALIVSSDSSSTRLPHDNRLLGPVVSGTNRGGFSYWLDNGNPFLSKLNGGSEEYPNSVRSNGFATQETGDVNHVNGATLSEDENEDLLADFIDEDSQLPSRVSRPGRSRHNSSCGNDEDVTAQTGSSLCLLR